jgi:phosphate transport system substrate-binding protein
LNMKKSRLSRLVVLTAVIGILTSAVSGCGSPGDNTGNGGSILVVGSSALQPLAEQAAKQYTGKNPNAIIQVQGGGSGNGLKAVADGTAQIGNSDIFAEEKSGIDASTLEDHKVCVVGFAAVVNPKVKIDNLTKQQLVDIFTGKIDNWSEVGGDNMPVVIINRPSSSGTRATFKKYALGGAEEASGKALSQDSSGAVLKTVADTDGAISYLALSYLKDSSVKALKLDGIDATVQSIADGKYPIWSYEHMYTKGPAQGTAKAFIEYMMSDEVKSMIQQMGYIPISDMKISR